MRRREFVGAALAGAAGPGFRLEESRGDSITAFDGNRPLFTYRYTRDRPKPYVHPLYFPDGRPVTVDSPSDHVHHRGLMLAWSNLHGHDFWGEVNPGHHGQIVHQRFDTKTAKREILLVAVNHWVASGKTLLVEKRALRVPPAGPEGVFLEWTSELTAGRAAIDLDPAKHVYNGLGMRFVASMALGKVRNARGTDTIEKANGEAAPWCTYYGALEPSGTGGVAILDHPANPRHPTPFFVMHKPYGYISAAPTFEKPIPMQPGQMVRFRWAVFPYLGEPDENRLNALFQRWGGQVL